MKYIEQLIDKATAASGEPTQLFVVRDDDTGLWKAYIAGVGDPELQIVTLESDWNVELVASADTIEKALLALDAVCALDYPDVADAA